MSPSHEIYNVCDTHLHNYWLFIAITGILCLVTLRSKKLEGRSFGLMMGVWSVINIIVAILLEQHIYEPPEAMAMETILHVEKWMRINIVLDVAYGILGAMLVIGSQLMVKWKTRAMLFGFGIGVLFQTCGLMLLDVLHYRQVILLM